MADQEIAKADQVIEDADYLTVAEVAELLKLEEKTIRKYIRNGVIVDVKRIQPANQLRIPRASLAKLFSAA